jgi:hypothetical protein
MKEKIFKGIGVLLLCCHLGGCIPATIVTVATLEHKKKQAYREYVAETEQKNIERRDKGLEPIPIKPYSEWKEIQ